nr:hypothetical protein [Tanacetum cinerariifolium]
MSAGIVQAAKLRKKVDIMESGQDCAMPTQDYIRKLIEDAYEDVNFTQGPWVSAVESGTEPGLKELCTGHIWSWLCTPNALGDISVTLKDPSGTISGGSEVLDEEEIIKLLEEKERVEVEWQDKHKLRLDEEALIHTLKKEARANEKWEDKLRQKQESDDEHEKRLFGLYV